ncbi:ABC transporter permease [Metallumcola ferriviriculae]|uniref:ABC transporter permease n=1 Tax=Metallumcola ferriviriculae TaxID=3039180 RepID=A0AAU0UT74_9FIRM|nr:ABC transporter permease [Desulfitibacteraceae bacterium MK1]
MIKYIIRRLVMIIPVLVGVSILAFLLIHLIPGNPAVAMLGERATPEQIAHLEEALGLNDPIYVQYGRFMGRILHGDFGRSIHSNSSVLWEMGVRFPATIELTMAAMFVAVVVGMGAGIISAVKPNSIFDHISMGTALVGVSMPIFWLGLMMIYLFGVQLKILPPSGRLDVAITLERVTNFYVLDAIITGNWVAFKDALLHLVMPAVALGTIPMAMIARMTRSSMLEVMRQDYIRTARAKGLAEKIIILRHALKNAFLPVLTVIGLQFGYLLGGAVMTEWIFSWPGIGRWIFLAIGARDFPIVQGGILLIATVFVIVNLLVDVLYTLVDPRIRFD